ncbi:hypothetical protein A7U60_g1896 [Sanghuangporus baumii]|uniref:JmjC domain-containing protein n=1 Tax=Sanghuangporus baumii TaxID=108892 RepID=A0A9Q5N8R9_SANBA|nr:hypothetical protein A7U60_g1896 [Sanghuangporus baumii]
MAANLRQDILGMLAVEYQELNGSYIETLYNPSAIDFLRAVRIGRPVIIKGTLFFNTGFRTSAHDNWTDEYLIGKMEEIPISVAVTPDGNADAIVLNSDGLRYFVEPHVERIGMRELLRILSRKTPDQDHNESAPTEVYYLQSQNGNLYALQDAESHCEFDPLRTDVPKDVSWATEALGISPDAVNIWIGDERSVTSIHSDPYENIYTVVRGEKRFTLFPPTEGWLLRERMYPHAKYTRQSSDSPLVLTPSPPSIPPVRWSSVIDPTDPQNLPPEARPLHITVQAGDTLYLPVGWWHHVQQKAVTIALNWWYDMEARGMEWVWLNFLRGESEEVPDGNIDD